MATSRRSSQQQKQSISSPPRSISLSLTPPGSPPVPCGGIISVLAGAEVDSAGDPELTPASPDIPAPALSSSNSTTTGGSSSAGSSPDSGSNSSPGGSDCGTFRELFEACRNGDVSRVKRLVDTVNVNAKDMAGRKSTPLHFAAGSVNDGVLATRIVMLCSL